MDNAFEKARQAYGTGAYDDATLEFLFPQLKESEDENLKNKSGYYKAGKFWKASTLWNATKDKIPQRVPNRYILQECVWNIGTLQQFADEIKNVQEVSLDYPIILDINGNILDGAHRVVKAYLEGKDIDIVYLGDDEWPEPDYDEEKAVKESEDERIRKWILEKVQGYADSGIPCPDEIQMANKALAYLEKQKEQKPVEEDSSEKDLAEYYLSKFDKKFPILPTLKGKQLADYKNFLNTCQQLFGLKEWDIHPTQAKLFAKLTLLWASWGAEHLQGLGAIKGDNEMDEEIKSAEWSEEDEEICRIIINRLTKFDEWASKLGYTRDDPFLRRNPKDWLKSLRPSWMPSEEQMQGLRRGIVKADEGSDAKNAMVSLYNDLEKL